MRRRHRQRRDCLDCHGTLEFDAEDKLWKHTEGDDDCPNNRRYDQ